jgi:hypothetical protein
MKDKTTIVVGLCIGVFVVALVARFYMTGNFAHLVNLAGVAREHFMQQEIGAPANSGGMEGVYSGIDISNGNSWSETTAPVSVLKGYEAADDNQLFEYQNSKFTPECCTTSASSVSNDAGCLCMSKAEEKKLAYRGGNRTSA